MLSLKSPKNRHTVIMFNILYFSEFDISEDKIALRFLISLTDLIVVDTFLLIMVYCL